MDNHFHLLVTPQNAGDVGRLMQRLGTHYVCLFNARHGRTGSLWEGRYKACLVGSEDYVLRCHRYIELNPVRARLTDDPTTYRWSSCPAYLGERPASGICPHPVWQGLASSQPERQQVWRRILDEAHARGTGRGDPPLPATATGTGPRCLQGDGRSQDPTLCLCAPCPSSSPTSRGSI